MSEKMLSGNGVVDEVAVSNVNEEVEIKEDMLVSASENNECANESVNGENVNDDNEKDDVVENIANSDDVTDKEEAALDNSGENIASERNNELECVNHADAAHKAKDKKRKLSKFERKKRTKSIIAKVLSVLVWIIGVCALFLCFSNLYQHMFNADGYTGFFGIGEAVVASNSMEPELCVNDLIFYKQTDASAIAEGDTVVYKKLDSSGNTMLVVHEVIQMSDGYVITQGINNSVPDEAFPESNIIGKYVFKISGVGTLLNLLSSSAAPFIIILIVLLVMAIRLVVYYWRRKNVLHCISVDKNTRVAINHFFDI